MGLVYTLDPFSEIIFTEKFKFTLQGGTEKPFDDLDVLMCKPNNLICKPSFANPIPDDLDVLM